VNHQKRGGFYIVKGGSETPLTAKKREKPDKTVATPLGGEKKKGRNPRTRLAEKGSRSPTCSILEGWGGRAGRGDRGQFERGSLLFLCATDPVKEGQYFSLVEGGGRK